MSSVDATAFFLLLRVLLSKSRKKTLLRGPEAAHALAGSLRRLQELQEVGEFLFGGSVGGLRGFRRSRPG